MRRKLRLPVSREQPLLIALYTKQALTCREIREIPRLLTHNKVIFIKYLIIHLIILNLILLRIHHRRRIMESHHRIRAIFREQNRLPKASPLL